MPILFLVIAGGFVLFVLLEGSASAQESGGTSGGPFNCPSAYPCCQIQPSGSSAGAGTSGGGATYSGGGACCVITSDPSTWPNGDAIWTFAQAIAFAEGANLAGSVPDRTNNPGDLSDGAQ